MERAIHTAAERTDKQSGDESQTSSKEGRRKDLKRAQLRDEKPRKTNNASAIRESGKQSGEHDEVGGGLRDPLLVLLARRFPMKNEEGANTKSSTKRGSHSPAGGTSKLDGYGPVLRAKLSDEVCPVKEVRLAVEAKDRSSSESNNSVIVRPTAVHAKSVFNEASEMVAPKPVSASSLAEQIKFPEAASSTTSRWPFFAPGLLKVLTHPPLTTITEAGN